MSESNLSVRDFEKVFGEPLTPFVAEKISAYGFQYRTLQEDELTSCWQRADSTLKSTSIVRAGAHRYDDWEKGWNENAQAMKSTQDMNDLLPRYFHKIDIVRWKQEWIKPLTEKFEYEMFAALQYWIFDKYLRNCNAVYEFGCGTGHNLLRAMEVNPTAKFWGLDWTKASQDVISTLQEKGLKNIFAQRFNFFEPDYTFNLEKNSVAMTICDLEQSNAGAGFTTIFTSQGTSDQRPTIAQGTANAIDYGARPEVYTIYPWSRWRGVVDAIPGTASTDLSLTVLGVEVDQ
jgi:hypothetical protein